MQKQYKTGSNIKARSLVVMITPLRTLNNLEQGQPNQLTKKKTQI